jgi:hypothetical protein
MSFLYRKDDFSANCFPTRVLKHHPTRASGVSRVRSSAFSLEVRAASTDQPTPSSFRFSPCPSPRNATRDAPNLDQAAFLKLR